MRSTSVGLVALLSLLEALPCNERTESQFLKSRGWVPLGKSAETGLEGWGRLINGEAVCIDEPDALKREGWRP